MSVKAEKSHRQVTIKLYILRQARLTRRSEQSVLNAEGSYQLMRLAWNTGHGTGQTKCAVARSVLRGAAVFRSLNSRIF